MKEYLLQLATDGWLPIDNQPVGLITWYASTGTVVALVTSWLGVINGHPPELRAGCCGRIPGAELFPSGADFAVNVPAGRDLPMLRTLARKTTLGCPLLIDAGLSIHPARSIRAPLLSGCTLQIECAHGRFLPHGWEPELAGDILLLHRGGIFFDPANYPDFCAIQPLRAVLVS